MSIDNLSIKELKALAYDQLAVREQTNRNLELLNRRIAEVSEEEAKAAGLAGSAPVQG